MLRQGTSIVASDMRKFTPLEGLGIFLQPTAGEELIVADRVKNILTKVPNEGRGEGERGEGRKGERRTPLSLGTV
jgi:hypothetical protein